MLDHRAAAAVPSRVQRRRIPRRALLAGLLGTAGWVALGGDDGPDAQRAARAPETSPGSGTSAGRDGAVTGTPPPGVTRAGSVDDVPAAAPQPPATDRRPPLLARRGPLVVHLPAAAAVLVAWHEASTVRSLALDPIGRLRDNGNPTRFSAPAPLPDGPDVGVDYDVQVSRGRSAGPTSAADVVLADREPVLAPVTGTVTEVRPYLLYGRYDDVRIELRPDDAPELGVVLIHVTRPAVVVGQRVAVGDRLAAAARLLPFRSIVDRATEPERFGHVHVELQPAGPSERPVAG